MNREKNSMDDGKGHSASDIQADQGSCCDFKEIFASVSLESSQLMASVFKALINYQECTNNKIDKLSECLKSINIEMQRISRAVERCENSIHSLYEENNHIRKEIKTVRAEAAKKSPTPRPIPKPSLTPVEVENILRQAADELEFQSNWNSMSELVRAVKKARPGAEPWDFGANTWHQLIRAYSNIFEMHDDPEKKKSTSVKRRKAADVKKRSAE